MVHVTELLLAVLRDSRLVIESLLALVLMWIKLDQVIRKRREVDRRVGPMEKRLTQSAIARRGIENRRHETRILPMVYGLIRRHAIRLAKVFVR